MFIYHVETEKRMKERNYIQKTRGIANSYGIDDREIDR